MHSRAKAKAVVHSVARVRKVFAFGLGAMAFLWLFVIPSFELWQRYAQARLEARIRLALVADRISSYVAANLDIWEFEAIRLPSVVAEVLRGGTTPPSRLSFVSAQGGVNDFPVAGTKGSLNLTLEDEVTDGSRPVGRVIMEIPLDDALKPALLSGGAGLVSMGLLLLLARMIGRKALDRSLLVIEDTTNALAQRVEELEETRRQLAAHTAHLKQATEDIAHVAQLTTHHLREPLRTILSYSQLLVRWHNAGAQGEDGASHLGFLKIGVDRMQTQLRALSSYLGLRERPLEPAPVILAEAVATAADRLGGETVVVCGALPTVFADPDMLVELLADLMAHAARHCDGQPHPTFQVAARLHEGQWQVRIADNGPPLAERDPDRLFYLLVHAEGGQTSAGLAAAKLMAFLLGGELWAEECEAGQGAVLCFTVPPLKGPEAQS